VTLEAYCVESSRPVRYGVGDRCLKHGARDAPCPQATRAPQCTHPRWPDGSNGSPNCPECGRPGGS
jgi:hypothetical protein